MEENLGIKKKDLDVKHRKIKRWTMLMALLALLSLLGLGGMVLDRLLKGAEGGGLEINYNKLDKKLAWLGTEIRDVNTTIKEQFGLSSDEGVLINSVTPDSPADDAGLQRGDVILKFGDEKVVDSFQMQDLIADFKPGDSVDILLDPLSGGQKRIRATLGTQETAKKIQTVSNQPDDGSADDDTIRTPQLAASSWGISVSPLTEALREQFNIPSNVQGVVVVAVTKTGLADAQNISVGDVVLSINKMPTPNLQAFYSALSKDEGVVMDIFSLDEGKRVYISLPDEGSNPPQSVLGVADLVPAAGTKRIAIPSEGEDINSTVFSRFSTAPYFIIYDLSSNQITILKNPYAAYLRGTGIAVAQEVLKHDLEAVITGGIGPRAFDALYQAKVKVYAGVVGTVRDVLAKYNSGALTESKEANLAGYGYSNPLLLPTGGGPPFAESEEEEEEEEGGYKGQPEIIPPKGKSDSTQLTAGSEPRLNRPDVCICPNCSTQVTHPASISCSDMVCPNCGSRLMNLSPGNDSDSGPTQLPAGSRPEAVGLTGGKPDDIPPASASLKTSSNLWTISGKPENIPPVQGNQSSVSENSSIAPSSQVATCLCPLCETQVTHPVGIPCSALQCPTCGSRMVASTSAAVRTAGPEEVPPNYRPSTQAVYYLFPVSSKPENIPPVSSSTSGAKVSLTGGKPENIPPGQQTFYLIPVAGGPTEGGPNTGGPTSGGPAVDGPSQGGQSSNMRSGASIECLCPMCKVTVTHPIGVPCASLNCPVCGSRLVNAQPGGTSGGGSSVINTSGKPENIPGGQQAFYLLPVSSKPENIPPVSSSTSGAKVSLTGGKPEDIPPVSSSTSGAKVALTGGKPDNIPPGQQTLYLVPVAGGPTEGGPNTGGPTSGGPAVDGPSQGGQSSNMRSGASTECLCPMCKVTVTHPIGVPCASLTCPVCGSRLVNAEPGGSNAQGSNALVPASQANIVQTSIASSKIAVPSTGRSLRSDVAPLFDKAPYFLIFGLGDYEALRNPYYRDSSEGGVKVAQYIVGKGVGSIVCDNISMTALRALKDLKVKVYSGLGGTVQQVMDIYAAGRLKDGDTVSGIILEDEEEGHGGGGGPPTDKFKSKDKKDKDVL